MIFFVGWHRPPHAHRFDRCMISANVLSRRVSDFPVNDWIMDSGAFTEVVKNGGYRSGPADYARSAERWSVCGNMLAAVSQDYMCEEVALNATGMTIRDHQRLTVSRYDAIRCLVRSDIHIMPVLQGYRPREYVNHIRDYGARLSCGMWVGVGSVCKRNSSVSEIEDVLGHIKEERSDLLLHGFGIKLTALRSDFVWRSLHSSDSMAWSYAARMNGGDANSWDEALAYENRITGLERQTNMFLTQSE